ncbi:MAG: hypothetical protein JXR83_00015 [Deltaproteobacteria bacterium]|nr:hypothetical protein [Deltaproteobacteria bacterium]
MPNNVRTEAKSKAEALQNARDTAIDFAELSTWIEAARKKATQGPDTGIVSRRSEAPSPAMRLRTSEARRNYPMMYLVAKKDDGGRSLIPHEAIEALEEIEKKHKASLRRLPTSELGNAMFDGQAVYSVKPSLLPRVEAVVAKYPQLSIIPLSEMLRPTGVPAVYDDAILAALQGDASPAKTLALRSVHAALTGQADAGIPTDASKRDAIGDAVYSAMHDYVKLFNATLLEASRVRREELLAGGRDIAGQRPDAGGGSPTSDQIGEIFGAYLGASELAIDELRKAGGTVDLLAARDLVLMSAEVLEKLGTPRTQALLFQVIPQGDGVILASLAQRPAAVQACIDAAIAIAKSRLDQTAIALQQDPDQRPDDWRGMTHSGGYENLPGSVNRQNHYQWSKDYPFDDLPTQPLAFLGTEHSAAMRQALTDFLLYADAGLPKLLDLHQEQYLAKETKNDARSVDNWLKSVPEDQRAAKRAEWLQDLKDQALERYHKQEKLTCQLDVTDLINALAWYGLANEQVYSETRAFTEIAGLFDDVLAKVKTPQMHRLLADAALSTLARYAERKKTNSESEAAAVQLRQRLATPGPDAEVHLLVAARFAEQGGAPDVRRLDEGLQHASDDVQRAAITAVTALIDKGRGAEIRALVPTLEQLLTSGISIWTKLDAATALGAYDPGQPQAVALATAIFLPDVSTERVGAQFSTPKNHVMRCKAAKALAAHGPQAASALPALDAAVAVGEKAKDALAVLEEKSKAAADAHQTFELLKDPTALTAVQKALEAGAWRTETPSRLENSAARVLRYLADPTAKEFANIPSYSSDRPNPLGALTEFVKIGSEAAAAARIIRG